MPGSKDVVLTPLKPPTKASISLDAIQSSLYYLHVETPDDEVVRQSVEAERRASQENQPPVTPIQRKPLPPTSFANYPPSRRPPTPPKSYPHYQPLGANGDTQYDRFAARGNNVRLTADNTARPLGARPMPSAQNPSPRSQDPNFGEETAHTTEPLNLEIPERPALTKVQSHHSYQEHTNTSPTVDNQTCFNVTVIRRDPTSGAQWNVGSIRVGTRKHHLAPLAPVQVNLIAPGYSRFAATPDSASPQAQILEPHSADTSPTSSKHFTRHVGFRDPPQESRTSLQDVRTRSNSFTSGPGINGANNKKPRQIYCFTSPWQGTCIFSNGVDGKSLKVRHSLAAHQATEQEQGNGVAELRLNLPWSVLKLKDTNRHSVPEPETLPISQLLGSSKKDKFRRSMQHFRSDSKQFLRELRDGKTPSEELASPPAPPPTLPPRRPPQDEEINDEYRLSLRLGREKAGGGFKGNSAKLGKLILDDEGLKMGDLVVACCMGVFWQHHEG